MHLLNTALNKLSYRRWFAFPRQVAMYLCREMTDSSLPQIGEYFGGRDHTTVLHAYKTIEEAQKNDRKLNASIQELIQRLSHAVDRKSVV